MRIVSLLPAATETACALGLAEHLVGVSHECDGPPPVPGLPRLTRPALPGGLPAAEIDRRVREAARAGRPLYALDTTLLRRLRPDLVLTQSLCGVCAVDAEAVRAALAGTGARVLELAPRRLADVLEAVRAVGEAAGVAARADAFVAELRRRIEAVRRHAARAARRPRVVFLEWLDPPYAAGHWNPELVTLAGGREVLGEAGLPSRRVTWDEIAAAAPDVVLIACCGMAPAEAAPELERLARDPRWRALPAVRAGRVHLLDGARLFTRPGPGLVQGLERLAGLLHPEPSAGATAEAGAP